MVSTHHNFYPDKEIKFILFNLIYCFICFYKDSKQPWGY